MVLGQRLSKGTTSIWNVDFFSRLGLTVLRKFAISIRILVIFRRNSSCYAPSRKTVCAFFQDKILDQWTFYS